MNIQREQYPNYPRLRDIRKHYPGDLFTTIDDTWCYDRIKVCQVFAEKGMCNGTFTEVDFVIIWNLYLHFIVLFQLELQTREHIDEAKIARDQGFTLIPPDEPQPLQVMEMAMNCR